MCVRVCACVSAGTAMSAGSRARPGKAACESRCRVLAWAGRRAWGQPGPKGRRRQVCNPGPGAFPSPEQPHLWEPCQAAWLVPAQGTHPASSNTLHTRLCPLGMLQRAPPSSPLPQRPGSAPLLTNEATSPPPQSWRKNHPLVSTAPPQTPPHFPYWSPSPTGQCGKELLGIWPTPHPVPAFALCRSWGT